MVWERSSRRNSDLTSAACAVGRDLPTPGQHGAAEDGEAKDNQRPSHLTEPRSILEGQYD